MRREVGPYWQEHLAAGPLAFDENLARAFSDAQYDDDGDWGIEVASPQPGEIWLVQPGAPHSPWLGDDWRIVAPQAVSLAPREDMDVVPRMDSDLVRKLAGAFGSSEVFRRASELANVTSWSSEETRDATGAIHRVVRTCHGSSQNCSTSEESVQLPASGAVAAEAPAQKATSAPPASSTQAVPMAMKDFADELKALRGNVPEREDFTDEVREALEHLGITGGRQVPSDATGEGRPEGQLVKASKVYTDADGNIHREDMLCRGSRCVVEESVQRASPEAVPEVEQTPKQMPVDKPEHM